MTIGFYQFLKPNKNCWDNTVAEFSFVSEKRNGNIITFIEFKDRQFFLLVPNNGIGWKE